MIVSESCAAYSMANEALVCFTSLLENVPGWIADLESILKAAEERQEEILFTQQPPPSSATASSNVLPKSRSSLKSKVSKASLKEAMNRANALLRPQKKHITQSDPLRLSQRKRKTESVYSGNQSGPPKFRNKAAAVVYYDGETQKRFEKLVRAIGSSRNAIRKGKMSAKVDALARTGSSSSEANNSSGEEDNDLNPLTPRLHYKSTRPERLPAFGRSDNIAVFDRVDGQLEKAQSLCERAAHQILRDGDCTLEARNAKEHFADAMKMAEEELPALKKRAERAAEREKRHQEREERRRAEEEAEEQRRKSASELAERIISAVAAAQPSEGINLEADALEVDESSESDDEEFDISAMQLPKFAPRMRSPKLAAH